MQYKNLYNLKRFKRFETKHHLRKKRVKSCVYKLEFESLLIYILAYIRLSLNSNNLIYLTRFPPLIINTHSEWSVIISLMHI